MSINHEISLNEIDEISRKNDGFLTPDAIVEHARNPASSLHNRFDWDDSSAAQKYRLQQARGLIRSITVTVVRQPSEPKTIRIQTTRAYQSLPSQRGSKGYEKVTQIMPNNNKRNELLATVLKEMISYRNRYADLSELGDIWAAIDKKAGRIEKPQKKRA